MIGGRGGVMILTVSCGLLIFSVLEVMSEWPCETPLINIAVNEGTLNTLLYSPAYHSSGEWKVRPTTDGNNEYSLVTNNDEDYVNDDQVYPDYAADFAYDYNSGLTIKNATTTAEPGHKFSTAGLYSMFCNSATPNNFRSKVLVVREGPTCNCTWANSQEVNLVCGSIYADSHVSPIRANYTIYIDGTVYANEAPAASSNDEFTSTSTASIRTVYSASSIYQCVQTFNAPDAPVSYLASNAPEFNQQCSWACPAAPTTEPAPTTSTHTPITTPGEDCSKTGQCQPESGTDNTGIYMYIQRVVKAQLYTRSDKCCTNNQVCGVVVTLQNGSRYLIHDAVCNNNSLNMAVVSASCMSSDWNLVSEKNITVSIVGAFVAAGNIAQIGSSIIPVIQSCNVMMILP